MKLDAYNGGTGASTVTLSCAGQTPVSVSVGSRQQTTITTGWTAPCTTVTVGSSNGWSTNFDNVVFDAGRGLFWVTVVRDAPPDQLVSVDPVSGAVKQSKWANAGGSPAPR